MIIFCSVLFILRWTTCKYVSQGNSLLACLTASPCDKYFVFRHLLNKKRLLLSPHIAESLQCSIVLECKENTINMLFVLLWHWRVHKTASKSAYSANLPQLCPSFCHAILLQFPYYFTGYAILSWFFQKYIDILYYKHQNTHFFYIKVNHFKIKTSITNSRT